MLDRSRNGNAAWSARAHAVLPEGGLGNYDPRLFIKKGRGSRVWDEDGREYLDLMIGSGPTMLGHGHPEINAAVQDQLVKGTTFFANNAAAVELAEEIVSASPCAEAVRFLSSGSEADMYAIRLARAFTGRDKILKFEGGYHGMCSEGQMSLAPRQLVAFPHAVPDSAGIPSGTREDVLVAPFNDLTYSEELLAEHGENVAAIIVEPMQRIVPPVPGFLEGLRQLADRHGAVLIFDEVVTGFRLAYGGAQATYGVTPDIATYAKIVGGGFPLAAVAGRRAIMNHFDKEAVGDQGWLMMVGTLSGNPIAAAAGLKMLEILRKPGAYDALIANGERLIASVRQHLTPTGIPFQITGHPTLFDMTFLDRPVHNYRDLKAADARRTATANRVLRANGIFKSPRKFYSHLALTEEDFALFDHAMERTATALTAEG